MLTATVCKVPKDSDILHASIEQKSVHRLTVSDGPSRLVVVYLLGVYILYVYIVGLVQACNKD